MKTSMRSPRVQRDRYVLEKARGAKQILHVGCACSPNCELRWNEGRLVHRLLCEQARRIEGQKVTGIDIDETSLDFLRGKLPQEEILFADAHRLEEQLPGRRFDLIVAGDVIEHLENPGLFLEACAKVLTPDGCLLISTINAFGVARFVKALVDHESVHPEHTVYFSWRTLERLCKVCGLEPTEFAYCACTLRQNNISGFVGSVIEAAFALAWPQFSDGIAMMAKLSPEKQATMTDAKAAAVHASNPGSE